MNSEHASKISVVAKKLCIYLSLFIYIDKKAKSRTSRTINLLNKNQSKRIYTAFSKNYEKLLI